MALKIISPAVFAVLVFSCSVSAGNQKVYSPKEYFKNYALSTCLADGFEAKEIVTEAAAAARGYLELGDYSLEAHTEATLLGREFLKKKYKSKSGVELILMKCIDFYHSKELDNLAKKYEAGS